MGDKENEMDKRTIIGLLLMVAVFVGYSFYMGSEQEKATKAQNKRIEQQQAEEQKRLAEEAKEQAEWDALSVEEKTRILADENLQRERAELKKHGNSTLLRDRQVGKVNVDEYKDFELENDYIKVSFSPLGGKVTGVELKNYTRYNKGKRTEHVNLIKPGSAYFGIDLHMQGTEEPINTNDYYFTSDIEELPGGGAIVTMRLPIEDAPKVVNENSEIAPTQPGYIEYKYTINNTGKAHKDYLVGFELSQHNIDKFLQDSTKILMRWGSQSMQNEKNFTTESAGSNILYYDHKEDESDELDGPGSREKHKNLEWIAHKQQYFTSALIAKNTVQGSMKFKNSKDGANYVTDFNSRVTIPHKGANSYEFAFYYGPNDYNVMKEVSFAGRKHLEEVIPMGGWFIGWFNRYITIPIFNWLSNNGVGFGLIILILTIIVKLIILPLTYKSYMSTAKMRAIRPEMEEINKKYPKQEDAMKKQQALMELYRKAGVSPMGGCLPLLIQMPILWAMFRFFPASIELRGESFLWADDLSSYDSVLDLPFSIPFYGDHVSLFALLMAVALFGYSFYSYKQQAATTAGQPGSGVMKFMMVYFMPVMMLFFFNGYASGLCYYYFLSQMLTMLIMYLIRRSVNDDKVRERLLANAAKPRKKSRFQERYEEMLKQQQEQLNREQRRQRR